MVSFSGKMILSGTLLVLAVFTMVGTFVPWTTKNMHDILGRDYSGGRYGLLQTCTTGAVKQVLATLAGSEWTDCRDNDIYDNDFFRIVTQTTMNIPGAFSKEDSKSHRVSFARTTREVGWAAVAFLVFLSVTLFAASGIAFWSDDALPIIPYILSLASLFYIIGFPMAMWATVERARAFEVGNIMPKMASFGNYNITLDAGAGLLVVVGPMLAIMTISYWLLKRNVWDREEKLTEWSA